MPFQIFDISRKFAKFSEFGEISQNLDFRENFIDMRSHIYRQNMVFLTLQDSWKRTEPP
jgi:hypothetical protein